MELSLEILGTRIREERIKRNLTIEQLAEIVDLSPSFLGLVERSERGLSLEKLYQISAAFNTTIDSLVRDEITTSTTRYSELNALLHNMSDTELSFIVNMVKLMKQHLKPQK